MEDAPRKFFRLKPGGEVRLRFGYIIRCDEAIKNDDGDGWRGSKYACGLDASPPVVGAASQCPYAEHVRVSDQCPRMLSMRL